MSNIDENAICMLEMAIETTQLHQEKTHRIDAVEAGKQRR